MKHDRFIRIVEQLNYPISIINKNPNYVEFIDIDGVQKKINMLNQVTNTISLVQVLENGIWSIEALFQITGGFSIALGIVRDSYDIPAKTHYWNKSHTNHIGIFDGKSNEIPVYHKGQGTYGNGSFKDNQILRLEFDSFKGTLILFIDNVQQPVYFSGIKEKVRFIIYMYSAGCSCTIRSLKQLIAPTSRHVQNEVAVQW
ncbi:MAG: hypothetical protein EZS28_046349 [Streblomastix strix]|uniref:B30.2/SPRY domain-containing protein n=1 Tax=Streblomastix strix TaxID=222440 RepID=A0A5J4TIB8_9EUKA|nr:MAG: hypothetical protein EZS28_046349 [Streblomastix strix]